MNGQGPRHGRRGAKVEATARQRGGGQREQSWFVEGANRAGVTFLRAPRAISLNSSPSLHPRVRATQVPLYPVRGIPFPGSGGTAGASDES